MGRFTEADVEHGRMVDRVQKAELALNRLRRAMALGAASPGEVADAEEMVQGLYMELSLRYPEDAG